MRPVDADEAKRIAREYLTDPYHVISAVAVLDKTPTLTPPNEPLTLDELREMDGEPVWVEEVEHWALIDIEKSGQWAGIPFAVWAENGANFTYNIEGRELHCFRRPPEGEEDT